MIFNVIHKLIVTKIDSKQMTEITFVLPIHHNIYVFYVLRLQHIKPHSMRAVKVIDLSPLKTMVTNNIIIAAVAYVIILCNGLVYMFSIFIYINYYSKT